MPALPQEPRAGPSPHLRRLRQALDRLDHSTTEVSRLFDHLSKMRGGGSPLERLVEILRDAYPGVGG